MRHDPLRVNDFDVSAEYSSKFDESSDFCRLAQSISNGNHLVVTHQIRTRYGLLDRPIAAGLRQVIDTTVRPTLTAATAVFLQRSEIRTDEDIGATQTGPPFGRWAKLVTELFGPEQSELLEFKTVPSQEAGPDDRSTPAESAAVASTISAHLRAVALFLIAEASRTRHRTSGLSEEHHAAMIDALEQSAAMAEDCSATMSRWADDRVWSPAQLLCFLAAEDKKAEITGKVPLDGWRRESTDDTHRDAPPDDRQTATSTRHTAHGLLGRKRRRPADPSRASAVSGRVPELVERRPTEQVLASSAQSSDGRTTVSTGRVVPGRRRGSLAVGTASALGVIAMQSISAISQLPSSALVVATILATIVLLGSVIIFSGRVFIALDRKYLDARARGSPMSEGAARTVALLARELSERSESSLR